MATSKTNTEKKNKTRKQDSTKLFSFFPNEYESLVISKLMLRVRGRERERKREEERAKAKSFFAKFKEKHLLNQNRNCFR